MPNKTAEVWEKPAPKKTKHTTLTAGSKKKAQASAKKAGRSRPSLVDNINAAKAQKKAAGKKSSAAKKSSPAKTTSKAKDSPKKAPASKKKTAPKAKAAAK